MLIAISEMSKDGVGRSRLKWKLMAVRLEQQRPEHTSDNRAKHADGSGSSSKVRRLRTRAG